ncbi:hypothetical protein VH98_14100 [Acinetobacter brisouii]|nr:hypothetical protein VH98_14100 [Acinetobacter brisouii]
MQDMLITQIWALMLQNSRKASCEYIQARPPVFERWQAHMLESKGLSMCNWKPYKIVLCRVF